MHYYEPNPHPCIKCGKPLVMNYYRVGFEWPDSNPVCIPCKGKEFREAFDKYLETPEGKQWFKKTKQELLKNLKRL